MLNRSSSLAMSTSVLKALPGKLDIKRHSPSIHYIYCQKVDVITLRYFSLAGKLFYAAAGCRRNIHRGSYMSAHVLLNLLNELRKIDKM